MDTTEESSQEPYLPDWVLSDPQLIPIGGDLVAVGADLTTERILYAYSNGIFPWYEEEPVLWWSPDPRAILDLENFHIPRRLARIIRSEKFQITYNQKFSEVIRGCAENRPEGTWITDDMITAYTKLHQLGNVHSVECWRDHQLVGGIYGIAVGGFFAGESMFYRESDASKVALVSLVKHLDRRGFTLFDLQIINDHTESLGAVEISREVYLEKLQAAIGLAVKF